MSILVVHQHEAIICGKLCMENTFFGENFEKFLFLEIFQRKLLF